MPSPDASAPDASAADVASFDVATRDSAGRTPTTTMCTVSGGGLERDADSETACATANRIGRCTVARSGTNITQTVNDSFPATVDIARAACEAQMGTFAAS